MFAVYKYPSLWYFFIATGGKTVCSGVGYGVSETEDGKQSSNSSACKR